MLRLIKEFITLEELEGLNTSYVKVNPYNTFGAYRNKEFKYILC